MIYPIRYFGDPVLRQVARPVTRFDANLATLVSNMFETMFDANGIGLAAPQIGIPRQLFVAVELDPDHEDEDDDSTDELEAETTAADPTKRPAPLAEPQVPTANRDLLAVSAAAAARGVTAMHVFVNPKFTVQTGVQYGPDGCLSLPGLFVDEMERKLQVRVHYQDVHGEQHELEASGRFAHVLQHEYDHLNGVLFFDRLPTHERQVFLEENRRELADMQREAKALLKELRRSPMAVSVG